MSRSRTARGVRSGVRDRAARTIKRTAKVRINFKRLALSLFVLAFCAYFVCTVISQQISLNRKNEEIEAVSGQIDAATRETERLNKELESVNDPEYMERMAREKLGLVIPNERVYIDLSGD